MLCRFIGVLLDFKGVISLKVNLYYFDIPMAEMMEITNKKAP